MEQEIGAAVSVSETNITDSVVQDLSVNNAAEVSVTAERSEIAHVDEASVIAKQATVTARDAVIFAEQCHIASNMTSVRAEEVSVATKQANVTAGEAIISANVLQQANINETIITGAAVQDMSIESAKNVSVISEHTEISSQKATVQTVEANVSAVEAYISAETLQQTTITETSITGASVQDMSIESAKDVSVISEHTELASHKATVQTVEATLSAAEAHISAETLQQTNITETSITGAAVQDISIKNAKDVLVISEHTEVASQKATLSAAEAHISAETLQQTSITEANITDATVGEMNATNIQIRTVYLMPPTYVGTGANMQPMASGNIPTLVGTPPTKKKKKKKEKYVEAFKRDVNRDAYRKAKGFVTGLYKDQRLVEPEFEANPRVRELSHFFSGEMAPKKKEYQKEVGFSVSKEFGSEGNLVDLKQILQSFNSNENWHIAIVGQAGSGKTTFVERMVRDVAENNNLCGDRSSHDQTERRYEIIYFVFIRDLLDSESINAKDLLFGNIITDSSEKSLKYGYNWIIENQERVVFFFDGLDQATWSLGGHHRKINHKDKASTPTVMYNVITGHLFPRVKKVVSSREHCIAPLTGDLRPQLIYALVGLSPDDVKRLFIALLGDIGQQQWDRMSSTSPAIIPLSSVPVFLIYNAIVQKFNPENPPDTMTGVMLEILNILLRSQHIRDKQVLHKLKEMAFRAMSEGRVVFTKDELLKFGINADSIQDLVIKVPGRTRASHCLLEGNQQIYFSHQVIEENLAAIFLSEMGVGDFEEFVKEFIHLGHWSVVRKFVCGILLNPALAIDWPTQMLQIKDKKAKEEIMKRSLNEQLKETNDSTALIELFGALYESNDDELIRSHVHDIDFERAAINPSGMLAISSVMRRSGNLNLLRFSHCNLTTELFDIMMSNLKDSQLKLKKFVLKNRFNAELFDSVTKFTESCVDEMVLERSLGEEEVGIISRSVISKKVFINRISLFNIKMSEQFSIETGIVCSKYNVERLELCRVDLREIHLLNFLKHVGNGKLKKLDVGNNYNLGVGGMAATGIIVSQCEVEKVGMRNCNLTAEAMKAFKENVRDAKFKELNVSGNKNLGVDGISFTGIIVSQCEVEKVCMWNCNLTAEAMKAFKENVRDAKLKELDVEGNENLGVGGVSVTGIIVSQCEVEKVGMQRCNLTAETMKAFKENVRDAKINLLNLSENKVSKLGDGGLSTISEIVHQCQVQTLLMLQCEFNSDQLERFKALIADTGVEFNGY
ncbi:NACHT, LRR and PYD domains-containing protein 2-like [Styela clava]